MLKIIHNYEGDWVTIVKDNKTIYGNHSIDAEEILDILGIEYEHEEFTGTEDEWYDYVEPFGGEM